MVENDEGRGPEMDERVGGDSAEEKNGEEAREERGRPWTGPFSDLQEMVEDLVEGVRQFAPPVYGRFPRVEMIRTPDEYWVLLDVPGLKRDEVEVTTIGDELQVSGVRVRPRLPDGAQVRRSELQYGKFSRTLRLPADVDPQDVRARLKFGVLRLRLPRRSGSESRKVDIES
jgi:HSP20 family molecular chaperone IbpA